MWAFRAQSSRPRVTPTSHEIFFKSSDSSNSTSSKLHPLLCRLLCRDRLVQLFVLRSRCRVLCLSLRMQQPAQPQQENSTRAQQQQPCQRMAGSKPRTALPEVAAVQRSSTNADARAQRDPYTVVPHTPAAACSVSVVPGPCSPCCAQASLSAGIPAPAAETHTATQDTPPHKTGALSAAATDTATKDIQSRPRGT